jgi:hypothetical protein
MTIAELFPTLRSLPRADKLKVMQFLIAELSKDEEPSLQPGATYLLSSPLNSHAAAQKLAQLLDSEQATNVWDKMEKLQCDRVQVRSL